MNDHADPKEDPAEEYNLPEDVLNEPDDVPVVNQPYDIPLDELLSDEANPLSPEDVKKVKQIGLGILGIVLVVVLMSVYACQPKKASIAYGVCSTFLEQNTPYPQTLNYIGLEGSRTAIRIYFTSTDPFGQFKVEMFECKFGPDEKTGMKLTEVLRNRRPMDAELIRKFNMTLPAVIAGEPYLVLPGPEWKNPLLPR